MKKAYTIFLICSGIVILIGFIMIFTNQSTAVHLSGRNRYDGNFSGAQVVVAGLVMALFGWWGRKDKEKDDEKYNASKKRGY
jgi:hypothetical protein